MRHRGQLGNGFRVIVAAAMLAVSAASAAEPPSRVPAVINVNAIDGQALQGARGVISVNLAAGDLNAQFNGQAISITHEARGRGMADLRSVQNIQAERAPGGDLSVISVRENAFANAIGLIAMNQASGVGNAQANGVAISIGVNAQATDVDLAQSVSLTGLPARAGADRVRAIRVEESAFRHARGVVQVNQSAGAGNATANSFTLRLQTGSARP
jgi:hypothetical protein